MGTIVNFYCYGSIVYLLNSLPGNEGDGPEDVEQEADEEENEQSQKSSQTMATPSQVCGKLWTLSTSADKTF